MSTCFGNEEPNKKPKYDKEIYAWGTKRSPLTDYIEVSKAICKIIIEENNNFATGFFLYDASRNKFLLTNYHCNISTNSWFKYDYYNRNLW